MNDTKSYAGLLARILLSILFITAGYGKLGAAEGTAAYMASQGVPGLLVWPTIVLELLGGLAILVGFQTRIVALALAGFSVLAGLIFHLVPGDQMQMISLYKNLGLAGGFLLLAAHGAGALSLDALRAGKRRAATA
ncbi:DoxX family protein [Actibacterium sp. MT2.3-13A]|uniref:DoxX family protein n=1 Tax=Actibacterium sp. MT2.3-13A TaxID=2828332 RepID=UPI001BAA9372|nr:DoxX family protein [Actibacterium sp. MT2.3-13A]